jgi:hypothetical protein
MSTTTFLKRREKRNMKNQDIRTKAAENGIRLWQIAECLGIRDDGLSRKLRRELDEPEKARIMKIIDELRKTQNKEEAR